MSSSSGVSSKRAPGPAAGFPTITCLLRRIRQLPGRCRRPVPQPETLAVEPVLKSGRAGEMKPFQQVAAIELQCPNPVGCVDRLGERGGIAPEPLRHGELVLAPSRDHLASQSGAQVVQRAAQRGPGVLLVELGPEHRQQRVSPVIPAGRGQRQIRQQCQTLGLLQDGADLVPVRVAKVQDAECSKLDHGPLEIRPPGGGGNVT